MSVAGVGTRANPSACPMAGATRLGTLGFEVNLLKLGGLGDALVDDFGLSIRRAAEAQSRQERINRVLDERATTRLAAERERSLKIAQEAFVNAHESQQAILAAGSVNLRHVLKSTMLIGVLSLGAFAVTQIMSSRAVASAKGRSLRRSRKKSKRRLSTRAWSPRKQRASVTGPSPVLVGSDPL